MSNALSDVVADDLSKDYVERRAEDWARRIRRLFDEIAQWLPEGWKAHQSNVTMHEEMMRQHNVPAREVPVLHLNGPSGASAEIRAYGLWVIGANGRLDFDAPTGKFVIIDRADTNLDDPKPQWMIAPLRDRSRSRDLLPKTFAEALGA